MSRRCRTSQALAGAVAASALLAPGLAIAGAGPLVMGPLYVEPARAADSPAPPSAGGCRVEIVELKDSRRAPETLGSIVDIRAIQAPTDRDAWLRSVVDVGLTARGFTPSFPSADGGGTAVPGAISARITLHAMWISIQAMNQIGSVVMQMAAAPPGGAARPAKVYRGDQTQLYWSSSQGAFNGVVDHVFAKALDAMAADLRPLCPSATPGGSATSAAAAP